MCSWLFQLRLLLQPLHFLELVDTDAIAGHEAFVYELFGDKWGLVREVFFEGFRLLRRYLGSSSTPVTRGRSRRAYRDLPEIHE